MVAGQVTGVFLGGCMAFTEPETFPLSPEGFFVAFLYPGSTLERILETLTTRLDSPVLGTIVVKWVVNSV